MKWIDFNLYSLEMMSDLIENDERIENEKVLNGKQQVLNHT